MATSKEKAQEILTHIQTIGDARIRSMMGEYLLYVNEKLVGQICDDELFIKVTEFGESFADDLQQQSPYPGAKPAFLIPADKISDQAWLRDLITGTLKELPAPKKK
jgi:TfoX/Sxy family transcriptional regulator of competence genes